MSESKVNLKDDLVLMDIEASNAEEVIEILGSKLYQGGYVKQSYIQAIKDREKKFPTGLPTEGVGVAIPHTDVIHVNEAAIAVGILKKPVSFEMMGMPEEEVKVEVIFMLAIKAPQEQLEVLQSLMNIFQKQEVLLNIKSSKDPKEVIEIFSREMKL